MDRKEVDNAFLILTGISLVIALLTLAIIVCSARLHCGRRKGRRNRIKSTYSLKDGTNPSEVHELEWIDDRNSDLISSTIKVNSIHSSQPPKLSS